MFHSQFIGTSGIKSNALHQILLTLTSIIYINYCSYFILMKKYTLTKKLFYVFYYSMLISYHDMTKQADIFLMY